MEQAASQIQRSRDLPVGLLITATEFGEKLTDSPVSGDVISSAVADNPAGYGKQDMAIISPYSNVPDIHCASSGWFSSSQLRICCINASPAAMQASTLAISMSSPV